MVETGKNEKDERDSKTSSDIFKFLFTRKMSAGLFLESVEDLPNILELTPFLLFAG